ncbi:SPOSA6832_01952, partial [Sporobolomyces salmonicolor]
MPPKQQAGNPEWLEWVEGLAAKSEERGEKSAQTYKKVSLILRRVPCRTSWWGSCALTSSPQAARSLRECPVSFTHPDQALQLSGVGPKIVKYITDKLREKCEKEGLPMPDPAPSKPRAQKAPGKKKRSVEDEEAEFEAQRDARRQRTNGQAGPSNLTPAFSFQAHPDGHFSNLRDVEMSDDDGRSGPSAAKGKGKAKDYIPRQNSGAYAIILALYKNANFDEHRVWTTKAKIMQDGQEFSATPFDTGTAMRGGQAPGGQSYTYSAWSGMATRDIRPLISPLSVDSLTKKELVETDNKRPLKYALTEEGYTLAEKLLEAAGLPRHVQQPSSSGLYDHPSSSGSGAPPWAGSVRVPGGRPSIHAAAPRRRSPTPPLFRAVDDDPESYAQMRQAIELSRRENMSLSSQGDDPVAQLARQAARAVEVGPPELLQRQPSSPSSLLDGKRAATGLYATRPPKTVEAPSIANVGEQHLRLLLPRRRSIRARAHLRLPLLTSHDKRVRRRDQAEVSQTDDTSEIIYRIEYRVAQDLHPIVRGLRKVAALTRSKPLPGGTTKSAYMRERVSNEVAPGFPESTIGGAETKVAAPQKKVDPLLSLLADYKAFPKQSKDAMYAPPAEIRRLGADPFAPLAPVLPPSLSALGKPASSFSKPQANTSATAVQLVAGPSNSCKTAPQGPARPSQSASLSPKRPRSSASALLADVPRPLGRTSSQNPLQASFERVPGQLIVNRHPLDPVRDHVSTTAYSFASFQPGIWPAGSFKVYLIVDSREGTREQGKRIELCEKMEREGVPVDQKMLPLGDMLWVARKVDGAGRPTGEQDVVLDAIVERKRLDDLCSSIIDGRYIAQKIRLKDSGISHRIYLIEKYDVAAQSRQMLSRSIDEKFGKQIWTCKSQLQVNDGFYVHESANINDTINYLKKRTQVMAELYENTDLRIIPDNLIDRPSYLSFQQHLRSTQPSHRYLIFYPSFCDLNKPDAALTLRTQWAGMIQRVSGVSAEKAVQFLKRWETPIQFFEEAVRHEREVEEENAALDREEADAGGGGATKKRGQPKRRRKEDFVTEELEDGGTRGIKAKLGGKIFELFTTRRKYQS